MKNARSAPSAAELLAKANKLAPFFFERAASADGKRQGKQSRCFVNIHMGWVENLIDGV